MYIKSFFVFLSLIVITGSVPIIYYLILYRKNNANKSFHHIEQKLPNIDRSDGNRHQYIFCQDLFRHEYKTNDKSTANYSDIPYLSTRVSISDRGWVRCTSVMTNDQFAKRKADEYKHKLP